MGNMYVDAIWPLIRHAAPKTLKYLVYLLVLVNIRSWPLMWHFRVFVPVVRLRLRHLLLRIRTMFMSRSRKIVATDKWVDSIIPIGADPLSYTVTYKTWASLDDCDFYGHMSNSSYAKTMDASRFKCCMAMFPMLFRAGGWIALGATHFSFIREIPMLASYEVRVRVGTWDHKWMYVVAKFVTKPKGKQNNKHEKAKPKIAITSPRASDDETDTGSLFNPSADGISSTAISTPIPSTQSPAAPAGEGDDTSRALKAVAETLAHEPEEDGATLHTISVSLNCFKIGRITVPPALVFAINGFSAPPPPHTGVNGEPPLEPYSHTNPPPHWPHVKAVMSPSVGGSTRALRELLKGGWRDIAEGDARWWDVAMGGLLEERRERALLVARGLNTGLSGARNMWE